MGLYCLFVYTHLFDSRIIENVSKNFGVLNNYAGQLWAMVFETKVEPVTNPWCWLGQLTGYVAQVKRWLSEDEHREK